MGCGYVTYMLLAAQELAVRVFISKPGHSVTIHKPGSMDFLQPMASISRAVGKELGRDEFNTDDSKHRN